MRHRSIVFLNLLLLLCLASAAHAARYAQNAPATTSNADSCDIGPYPAATLLLPYFEVDLTSPQTTARTTLFTVTNVTQAARVVNVTLWTDYGYPALSFPMFLTGYDAQAINLYDILARGVIAAPNGTSSTTMPGPLSLGNSANPNLAATAPADCSNLPRTLPASVLAGVRTMLTIGSLAACGNARVGSTHEHAIGYATIDSVRTCSPIVPTDERYFTDVIAFENVLIGDYQQIDPDPQTGNFAGGNPLVHIRAVPGDGNAPTNLPFTFYDRLTPRNDRRRDRRQPLPTTFAARFIQGGTGNFNTNFKIWREAAVGPGASCAEYANEGMQDVSEQVRFDEHENPTTFAPGVIINGAILPRYALPATSSNSTSSWLFPPLSSSGDYGGWMYINAGNYGSKAYSAEGRAGAGTGSGRTGQDWVIVSMEAEGRYSVDFDAAALGNGCSLSPSTSYANNGQYEIAPLPNATP